MYIQLESSVLLPASDPPPVRRDYSHPCMKIPQQTIYLRLEDE
jgi:hypothetical protein